MPTVTIKLANTCSGGNHYSVNLTGDVTGTLEFTRDDVQNSEPITKREVIEFAFKALLRNLTPAQIRNRLNTGVTITLN